MTVVAEIKLAYEQPTRLVSIHRGRRDWLSRELQPYNLQSQGGGIRTTSLSESAVENVAAEKAMGSSASTPSRVETGLHGVSDWPWANHDFRNQHIGQNSMLDEIVIRTIHCLCGVEILMAADSMGDHCSLDKTEPAKDL